MQWLPFCAVGFVQLSRRMPMSLVSWTRPIGAALAEPPAARQLPLASFWQGRAGGRGSGGWRLLAGWGLGAVDVVDEALVGKAAGVRVGGRSGVARVASGLVGRLLDGVDRAFEESDGRALAEESAGRSGVVEERRQIRLGLGYASGVASGGADRGLPRASFPVRRPDDGVVGLAVRAAVDEAARQVHGVQVVVDLPAAGGVARAAEPRKRRVVAVHARVVVRALGAATGLREVESRGLQIELELRALDAGGGAGDDVARQVLAGTGEAGEHRDAGLVG